MGLEIHFVHGFLGRKDDWDDVIRRLPFKAEIRVSSLIEDFETLFEEREEQGAQIDSDRDFFNHWAQIKTKELKDSSHTKVLVGYSLGGRLLYHIDPSLYDRLIVVASNPGLDHGHKERLKRDQAWVKLYDEVSSEVWLEEWNSQGVFANDVRRPHRKIEEQEHRKWLELLINLSVAKQRNFLHHGALDFSKLFWLYGANDQIYKLHAERLQKVMSPAQIYEISGSGHGVLFDRPSELAHLIGEIVSKQLTSGDFHK